MEKIKLNLAELKVNSFEITKSHKKKGTVEAFTVTETYIAERTCGETCVFICVYTEQYTCTEPPT